MILRSQYKDPLLDGFLQGLEGTEVLSNYKDPFDKQWLGDPKRITPTQAELWPLIRDESDWKIALIGGKGSAKTCTASAYLIDRAQRYPGSKGFLAASTYQQATDSCAAELVLVAEMMKVDLKYHSEKIIDNLVHKNVYTFPEYGSAVCIRSADRMYLIEGSQWDHAVIEEVSFWKEDDLSRALSRLRRPVGDHTRLVVGMPEDGDHWMYSYFEANGFILREIDTRENEQNLPPGYIEDLLRMYPGAQGQRYVQGKRVSLHNMPTVPSYDSVIHKAGELSKRYTSYDEHKKLIVSFDFNVAPCCATVWQSKPIAFDCIREDELKTVVKHVLCQIDEYEVWSGATREVAKQIHDKYGPEGFDHLRGITIIGDAAGNASDTRNVSVTDWTIIEDMFSDMRDLIVRKGLIINRKKKGSRSKIRRRSDHLPEKLAKYSNPPLKDSVENLNRLHIDGDGHPGILYLTKSKFESGGCSSSVGSTRYRADGAVDESPDKKEGKKIRRTHYWATARYVAWYFDKPGKKNKRGKNRRGETSKSEYELKDRRSWKR